MKIFTVAILMVALLSTSYVSASYSFDAYRLLHTEVDGAVTGSAKASLSMQAIGDGVMRLQDVTIEKILKMNEDAKSGAIGSKEGLIILLPQILGNVSAESKKSFSEADLAGFAAIYKNWNKVEQYLLKNELEFPLYFALEDENLQSLVGDQRRSIEGAGWKIVAKNSFPGPIAAPSSLNIQGWLAGVEKSKDSEIKGKEGMKSIAIVAHHDTFSAIPGLASGVRDNGSGVAALLELARIFSKLYSMSGSQGRYYLIFVLSGGGKQNFYGAKHWLQNTDTTLLGSVEAAICLDTLSNSIEEDFDASGSGGIDADKLYLHVSRAQSGDSSDLLSVFKNKNKNSENIDIVHKKIDLSDDTVHWEHERFSKKHILAGTISRRASPMSLEEKSSLFDRGQLHLGDKHVKMLAKRVKIIAEALAEMVYGQNADTESVFEDGLAVSEDHLAHWLTLLSNHARHTPHTPDTSPILKTLELGLHQYVKPVKSQKFEIDAKENWDKINYDNVQVTFSLHHSQPLVFDIILLPIVLAYLCGLFVALKGFEESISVVNGVYSSSVRFIKKMIGLEKEKEKDKKKKK